MALRQGDDDLRVPVCILTLEYSNRSKSDPQQKVTTDSTDGIVSEVFSVE